MKYLAHLSRTIKSNSFLSLLEPRMNETKTLVTVLNGDASSSVDYTERAGTVTWLGLLFIGCRLKEKQSNPRLYHESSGLWCCDENC